MLFTGVNSYSGGTTVDAGNTLVGTNNSLQGNIANNGVVVFNKQYYAGPGAARFQRRRRHRQLSDCLAFAINNYWGLMSGTGSVEIAGGGIVTFSGTNSYTGGTTVEMSNVLVGSTASLQGTFTNNGIVVFSQSSSGTYAGNMSGTGMVQVGGTGPVTFSGTNNYSGGTHIELGSTLIGTTHSLQGMFVDYGHLQFSQTMAGTFAESISGTGGVEIGGVGPVTFSGSNTYTGGTTIDNGSTLIVGSTGSIAGVVNVNNGGTLMGEGSIASTTINAGGTIFPGTAGRLHATINGGLAGGHGKYLFSRTKSHRQRQDHRQRKRTDQQWDRIESRSRLGPLYRRHKVRHPVGLWRIERNLFVRIVIPNQSERCVHRAIQSQQSSSDR